MRDMVSYEQPAFLALHMRHTDYFIQTSQARRWSLTRNSRVERTLLLDATLMRMHERGPLSGISRCSDVNMNVNLTLPEVLLVR